jgi:hypothetical protein
MKGYQYTFRAISRQQEWSMYEWSTGGKFFPPIYHSKQLDERWTELSVVICHTLLRIYKYPFSNQSRPCMEQANDDQAEHPTAIPQILRHLATRTHLPF